MILSTLKTQTLKSLLISTRVTCMNWHTDDEDDIELEPAAKEILSIAYSCDSLQDMCSRLLQFNIDANVDVIKAAIMSFSVRIIGFPDCPDDDLPLAVYLMLEELLGIKSIIDLCAIFKDGKKSVVGVLFSSKKTTIEVLRKSAVLRMGLKIKPNDNFQWILDNY